jgi:hypothetical protein
MTELQYEYSRKEERNTHTQHMLLALYLNS